MARVHDALAAVGAAQRDVPLPARVVIAAAGEFGAGPEIQLQGVDVRLEPVRQHVLRNVNRPGRRERHIGHMVDVHFVVQRQRVIALAPIVADALVPVDDQRIDAELLQPRRDREAGLAAADHEHSGVAIGKRALAGEPVGPIFGAEIARRVRFRAPLEFFFVAPEFVQIRVQRPGAQPPLAVGHQADDAVARAECGLEFEDRLDRFGAGAADPARRRPPGRDMEIRRLRARERGSQRRLDRRPAGHGLDRPGEGQQVAPQAVGQEQGGGGNGILRAQRRFESREPAFGVGQRRKATAILDDIHPKTRQRAEMAASAGRILLRYHPIGQGSIGRLISRRTDRQLPRFFRGASHQLRSPHRHQPPAAREFRDLGISGPARARRHLDRADHLGPHRAQTA